MTGPELLVGLVALAAGWWRTGGWRPAPPARRGTRTSAGSVRWLLGGRAGGAIGCAPGEPGARWATRRDLRPLVVRAPTAGRLSLGTAAGRLLAAEPGHSVLVVGPTQSRKTTGFAVPAILEWEGPVVAASVKADLARDTHRWREQVGRVWVYDPSRVTGFPAARWSPLLSSGTWVGARRTAASLTEVARSSAGSLTDGDFWYATAAKLLAPLLFAAATSGRTMGDVVRWVDTQETHEIARALAGAGVERALDAAQASWARDDRQRSAVYSTAETVIEAFADPAVAASAEVATGATARLLGPAVGLRGTGAPDDVVDPAGMLDGHDTLYLCAPAHDQRRLRPVFATLVSEVIEAAYARSARGGAPLDPPLLVVLDEAANVAPIAELDVLASTAAGHGVQLVTVWQDFAQLQARYATRAGTVVNNHRVKVFLSGIADPATLEHASQLIGDAELAQRATTVDAGGALSTTDSSAARRLAPGDALRRLPPGRAVVVSGHLPPARLALRPWFEDRRLSARARWSSWADGACAPPLATVGEVTSTPPGTAPEALAELPARRKAKLNRAARAARASAPPAGAPVWDPYAPAWTEDPSALYAQLRRDNPVHRHPLGFWVFTRHADCLAILRDKRSSSDERNVDPAAFAASRHAAADGHEGLDLMFEELTPFLFLDPPDHTRLRGLVQKAFTPRVVEGLRPRAEEITHQLLDAAFERGQVDLVTDFAYPLPMQIIVEMLGVPAEDHAQFRVWSGALARGLDPEFLLPPDAVKERLAGILSFVQYFSSLIEDRRAHPGEDLLSRLIEAEEHGVALTQGELLSTCILLLVAGHETTVNLLTGGALALIENPDQLARLRDDPTVVRSAVEEALRYVSPVQLTGRIAREDMDVAGTHMARGELALLLLASANRDPDAFADPDVFDVARPDANHLGFGFGIHHCLGAPLARLEAQVALPALVRRAKAIERTDDELTYKENIVLRGLATLPVTLSA